MGAFSNRTITILALSCVSFTSVNAAVIEEITVTAQKREQGLQDVGVSVTAFSGDQLRSLNLESTIDLAQQTPGFQFSEGSYSLAPITNIRGVSQNDFSPHQESPNAIYVDQAYNSVAAAGFFQMYDLERVEILRGPQGTLYGRNATGGLIHFISRKPTESVEGYGDFTFGERGQLRFEGAMGGPITDTLKGRLSFLASNVNSYMKNRAGMNGLGREDYGVRGQLLFTPNDNLKIRTIVSYGRKDHTIQFGHFSTGFDQNGLSTNLPDDVDFFGTCPGCDAVGYKDADGDPYATAANDPGSFKSDFVSLTGIVDWQFDDVTLTSVTNYLDYNHDYAEDTDATPREGARTISSQAVEQFTQEIRLNGGTDRLRWLGGAWAMKRNTTQQAQFFLNIGWFDDTLAGLGAIPPGTFTPFGSEDSLVSNWDNDTTSWAVFGQVEYDIATAFTAIVGLRWSDDKVKHNFVSVEYIDGIPSGSFILGETNFTEATVGALNKYKNGDWSGKFELDWRPHDDWLLYISYSRGTKAGGFNAPFSGGPVTAFGGEVLKSTEAGFKSTLLGGLARLNVSAFHYDYDNYQGFKFENLAPVIVNENAKVNGFEAELYASPAEGWDFVFGVSYLDTKVKGAVETATGALLDTVMPLAPKWSLNGLARKSWQAFDGIVSMQADFNYKTSQYSDVLNQGAGRIGKQLIVNTRVSYTIEQWEFAFIVRNIGNEKTLSYRIPTGLGFGQEFYGPPRWFSGQISYKF
jgi:iron complex outermembrane receptor protein